MMDTIQNTDTAYQDDSKAGSPAPPRFTVGAARKARQVVALRPALIRPVHRLWASLGTGTHRARLLAGIVLFAVAGGVAGGLLAAANNNNERGIDTGSLTASTDASSQTDSPETISRSKEAAPISKPADPSPAAEFEGPELESAVLELKKRRPARQAKKAYRVAIIYPRDDVDFEYRRKRDRKH